MVDVKSDAADRAVRTFVVGLGMDVALAVAASVAVWVADADVASGTAWSVLGASVLKTVVSTVASYVLRLKVAPAGV